MENQVQFVFTPTKDDYVKALRAYYRKKPTYLVVAVIMFFVFLMGFFYLIFNGFSSGSMLFLTFLPVFFFVYLYFINPLQVGRKVQDNERLRAETAWQVSETDISITTKFAETRFDWGTFGDFIETDQYFLVVYSINKRMFQIVPKRAFDSVSQIDDFRNMLETCIDKNQKPIQQSFLGRYGKLIFLILILLAIIVLVVYNFQQAGSPY